MLKNNIQRIQNEVSASQLYQSVKEVSSFHRIQASDGYRSAAKHCLSYLEKQGIDAQILQYPANKTDYAGTYKLFQEWHIKEAYCDLVYPKKLRIADFQSAPISLIQKSYPCDYRNTPLDVILMDKGSDQAFYQDIDFCGKLVFIHEHFDAYTWAIRRGALGFISDFVNVDGLTRSRDDLYDALNYTSFWWKYGEDEIPTFGFVVTPRMGDELSSLAQSLQNEYTQGSVPSPYLQVCPYVDTTLADGSIDVVEATLPGKSDECVLITAHLCHPCASSNDNASGVSGAMEVLRTLSTLQKQNLLEPLEKTVKMILIPEFTGTYCYISDGRDTTKYIAGINLDMIGGRQQNMYGPITITNLPHACPSFVDSLASLIDSTLKTCCDTKEGYLMSLVHSRDVPFQLGSDHFILSDPMVNIPTIMLGQWPDLYYHTSCDTLDIIDPIVLKYSTVLACSYVHSLAAYDASITPLLKSQMRVQFVKALNDVTYNKHQAIAYQNIYQFFMASITKLMQFVPNQCNEIEIESTYYTQLYQMYTHSEPIHEVRYPQHPIRLFNTSIVDINDIILHDKKKVQKYKHYQENHPHMLENHALLQVLCDYYIDGIRSIDMIAQEVIAEAGYGTCEDMYAYIMFMCDIELMRLT